MFVPEKLKLNAYKKVAIPRPKDVLSRYGFREMSSKAFSGDAESSPMVQSKLDAYREADAELSSQLGQPSVHGD